jgi:hypothetical protein
MYLHSLDISSMQRILSTNVHLLYCIRHHINLVNVVFLLKCLDKTGGMESYYIMQGACGNCVYYTAENNEQIIHNLFLVISDTHNQIV